MPGTTRSNVTANNMTTRNGGLSSEFEIERNIFTCFSFTESFKFTQSKKESCTIRAFSTGVILALPLLPGNGARGD